MTSLRFEDLGGGNFLEALAPNINLEWDPMTNGGTVTFHVQKYLMKDGVLRSDMTGGYDTIRVPINDMITRCHATGLVDPVTNQPLGYVSVAGLMLIIKAAFDTLYNEELIRREEAKLQSAMLIEGPQGL